MKPLNYDNSPCSPTSSNCVIWQGPDLHIIKLCKGDTISDVIASLATELAIVMDQLSITNYDLSCFDLVGCKPETYQELLQFLIEQICSLQGLSPTDTTAKSDDVLITVAPCFIVNGVTVMTLIDYVTAIGLKICDIVDQIAVINNTLNEYNIRITTLENAVIPTYTLPSITVDCTLQNSPLVGAGTPALPIDQILSILINDDTYGYCALRTALGLPANLNAAVLSQCILNSDIQLSTGATWSTNPNWDQTPTTVADAINNIWLVICDYYDFLSNIDNVVVASGTNTNVTSSTVGNTTTYTVNSIGLDYYNAQVTIGGSGACNTVTATINNVANAAGKTVGYGGNNYLVPNRVQDILNYNYTDSNGTVQQTTGTVFVPVPSASTFVTLDNTTGIFSITKKGEYLLTMSCYLKANEGNSAYWLPIPDPIPPAPAVVPPIGRFDIGICSGGTNSRDIFTGSSKSIVPDMDSNIILNAQCTALLNVGNQVIFRVLNLSGTDYYGGDYNGADAIRIGIVKLRDL